MSRLRVQCSSLSLDGYGAGPDQSLDNPLGVGGETLHDWIIATRPWRRMHKDMTAAYQGDHARRRLP